MPDRWIAWCRRLAPRSLRDEAFDPSVDDLRLAACERPHGSGRLPRLTAGLGLRARILIVALQCQRLHLASLVDHDAALPWGRTTKGTLMRDLAAVIRRLWREPRFSLAVVLTLALGLGANLTVFTFVDAYLLAPLPVPGAEALLRVSEDRGNAVADLTSYPNYRDARDATATVIDLAAHTQTMALIGPPEAAEVRPLEVVSGNYFRVLQLVPQAGRLLVDADDVVELGNPVVVISDGYWRSRLAGRTDAVGQSLIINGAPFEIVGIAPRGFGGTYAAHRMDVWAPVTMQQHVRPRGLSIDRRTWGWLWMIGRVAPHHGPGEVEHALSTVAADINRRFPGGTGSDELRFLVSPVSALSASDARQLSPMLLTSLAFTSLLFLATCANLAGLMHARLAARRRELAIRQSLGAGRLQLMRDWMLECSVLALAGGGIALAVARAVAVALAGVDLPSQVLGGLTFDTTLQWRVVAYTFGLSLIGAALFGVGSAWRAAQQVPVDVLKEEGGTASSGRQTARARRIMVAVQVSVSVVLLMVASLLVTSLKRQQVASPGFDGSAIGLVSLNLQRQRVPEAQWSALITRAVDIARAVPGVADADVAMRAPLSEGEDVITVGVPGYDPTHEAAGLTVDFNQAGARYFATLGIPFRAGAVWDPVSGAPAVVINQTMADRYWSGQNPVGRTVRIGRTPATVAGVVADSSYYNVGESPRPYIVLPAHLQPPGSFVLHVRASAGHDPGALAGDVAKALAAADSRLAPFDVMSFDDLRQVPLFPTRLLTMAAAVFGLVSVVLTVVGLYGVIAASVGARTREIGVRLALGAAPDVVQRGVIGDALRLSAMGGAAGLAAGYLAARQLRGWLFDVTPFDAVVTTGVITFVAVLATASAWIPARRAARIDPVRALR